MEGNTNRRTILKSSAAAVTSGASIVAAIPGTATAEERVNVAVLQTMNYHLNHSNSIGKQGSILEFVREMWDKYVDRPVSFTPYLSPTVRANDFDNYFLGVDRVQEMDDWLNENWDRYGEMDAILVLDYLGNDDTDFGGFDRDEIGGWFGSTAKNGSAGGVDEYDDKRYTAAINLWHDDESNLTDLYAEVGSEGLAFHELAHLFNAEHNDATVYYNGASLMYELNSDENYDDSPRECNPFADAEVKQSRVSFCTARKIRNHCDSHIL
ncbi:hypothetical protein [Halomontanus rarus]|uniref:hypothetical protein n=1 Tax=Halomontanus rarus TaxID=3034020 RepID=UPI00307B6718